MKEYTSRGEERKTMVKKMLLNSNNFLKIQKAVKIALVVFMCLISVFSITADKAYAATDTKKPSVSLKVNTEEPTNGTVVITITAKDTSGIKTVKWEKGKKSTSYFKSGGTKVKLKSSKASVEVTENDIYTFYVKDKAGNVKVKRIEITNIDKGAPVVTADYSVMNQKAEVIVNAEDTETGIEAIYYLKGKLTDPESEKWEKKGNFISEDKKFYAKKAGNYSILAIDKAGNRTVYNFNVTLEMRAVWISYLEFLKSKDYSESEFQTYVNEMFDNCVSYGMNTVIVQVRPFSDAMYESKYFPWSSYASGTLGEAPGYDPLEYMVTAAHERGLEIHAWVNPYRITGTGTDISVLPENHPARVWRENKETERNVLTYGGALYYNPASKEVQNLIVNGIKEIVKNYDVDGIHFDDYFYPNLGAKYESNFDALEYEAYLAECEADGATAADIVTWRRNNVSRLVKKTYSAIKKIDSDCVFGISPQGNIDNLMSSQKYYVDIERWLKSSDFVDYICPQIYWGINHQTAPFASKLQDFLDLRTSDTVNVYAGLAVYKAGAKLTGDPDWEKSDSVIADEVTIARETGLTDGFMLYRYESLLSKKKEMENLMKILE